jgi:hypothetical protein
VLVQLLPSVSGWKGLELVAMTKRRDAPRILIADDHMLVARHSRTSLQLSVRLSVLLATVAR